MAGADRVEPPLAVTDAPTPDEERAIGAGLARYNEQQSGRGDGRTPALSSPRAARTRRRAR